MVVYKLYYFAARFLGEPIRMMFHYSGQKFDDIRIAPDEWPKFKKETANGKLPMLDFDGVKIGQSGAIYRLVASRFKLAGSDIWQEARVDEAADVLADIQAAVAPYFGAVAGMGGDASKLLRDEVEPACDKNLSILQSFLTESGGPFLTGRSVTYPDFVAADLFFTLRNHAPHLFDKYGKLSALIERVYGLSRLKKYIEGRPKSDI